jgi:hypothetical protein
MLQRSLDTIDVNVAWEAEAPRKLSYASLAGPELGIFLGMSMGSLVLSFALVVVCSLCSGSDRLLLLLRTAFDGFDISLVVTVALDAAFDLAVNIDSVVIGELNRDVLLVGEPREFAFKDVFMFGLVNVKVGREPTATCSRAVSRIIETIHQAQNVGGERRICCIAGLWVMETREKRHF